MLLPAQVFVQVLCSYIFHGPEELPALHSSPVLGTHRAQPPPPAGSRALCRRWLTMYEPRWSDNSYPDFDYQNISYYSAPKRRPQLDSIEEVDPALRQTWERLNIPVEEQKRLANVKPVRRLQLVASRKPFCRRCRFKSTAAGLTLASLPGLPVRWQHAAELW